MTSAAAQELGQSSAAVGGLDDCYWAAAEDKIAAREAMSRIVRTAAFSDTSGRITRWIRALRMHYGQDNWYGPNVGSEMRPGGEAGELLLIRGNHWRNFALHIVNTVTRDVLAFDTIANDTGAAARAANELARDVLADFVRRQQWDRLARLVAEWAVVCDSGALVASWDFHGGEEGMPLADGSPGRTGDVLVEVFGPHDVFFDLRCTRPEPDYYILRRWVNRWDLVAQYPEKREEILKFSTRERMEAAFSPLWTAATVKSDEVAMFEVRHRKTPALPNGRLLRFCDEDCVFYSGALPYDDPQVYVVSAGPYLDSSASFTSMYDILGMQEGYDAGLSALISTMDMAGVQNWIVPDDCDISVEELAGSARLIKSKRSAADPDAGKPELAPQPVVSQASVDVIKLFPNIMGMLVGVNDVTRGAPPDQVKAGNYAALLAQQTADFWTPLRRSLVLAIEGIATASLRMLAVYGDQERTIEIEGDEKGQRVSSFMGEKLEPIRRVAVAVANPMTQTPAGRAMLADNLAAHGWVGRSEYLDMVSTGKTSTITDPGEAQHSVAEWENERMAKWSGDPNVATDPEQLAPEVQATVPVLPGDDDALHIAIHDMQMTDPAARMNPAIVAMNTAHRTMHVQQLAAKSGAPPVPPPKQRPGWGKSAKAGGKDDKGGEQDEKQTPQQQQVGVKPPAPAQPPAGAPRPANGAPAQ